MTYQHSGVIVPLSGYWDYKGNNHHKENWSIVETYIHECRIGRKNIFASKKLFLPSSAQAKPKLHCSLKAELALFSTNQTTHPPEFPIVSSSSSMLEEPVRVNEEPKEFIVNQSKDILLRLPEL